MSNHIIPTFDDVFILVTRKNVLRSCRCEPTGIGLAIAHISDRFYVLLYDHNKHTRSVVSRHFKFENAVTSYLETICQYA